MHKGGRKYRLNLTQKQLMELLWWHDSDIEKWKSKGVKDPYLTIQDKNSLRTYIEMRLKESQSKQPEELTVSAKIQSMLTQIATARKVEAIK